jgi:hypothetical protein
VQILRRLHVQLQGPRERIKNLWGRMLGASPLESQVVLGANAGKHCQLLATQTRRAALSAGNQPDIFGTNLVPARTQVITQRVGPPCHHPIVRLS